MNTNYTTKILDTLTFKNKFLIILFADNGPSFSSEFYCLDLSNGKRIPGTFWASGHIIDWVIEDIDNDGNPNIIGLGYDNGFEGLTFFNFEFKEETSVRPTTEDYLIKNFSQTEMETYIRFPKNDIDVFNKIRTTSYDDQSFNYFPDKGNSCLELQPSSMTKYYRLLVMKLKTTLKILILQFLIILE